MIVLLDKLDKSITQRMGKKESKNSDSGRRARQIKTKHFEKNATQNDEKSIEKFSKPTVKTQFVNWNWMRRNKIH